MNVNPIDIEETSDDGLEFCKICFSRDEDNSGAKRELISPCNCKGSLKYVHEECLFKWMRCKLETRCELCGQVIRWKKPQINCFDIFWPLTAIIGICTACVTIWFAAYHSPLDITYFMLWGLGLCTTAASILLLILSIYINKKRIISYYRSNQKWKIPSKNASIKA